MTHDLLCERCFNPIDRTREPFRAHSRGGVTAGGGPVTTYVHALPCELPDTGDWDTARRGLSPAAIRHAAAQSDHR
ncbi:hypothetical protein [Pseudonocardia phyllosphaerae]|uniref:hypothetical protein n=1 Tax=Pseudonocardia phyllosphaerae TaxID=3390502 RepID=UPI00397E052F